MLQSLRSHYLQPVRSFDNAARLFLIMIIIDGVILSGWQLFFNFYMLHSGFTREFLGLVNSMPSAAGLILGIPLGRLSDRIGRRPSIILGIAMSSVFMLTQVSFPQPGVIVAAGFLNGASNMLFVVSQAPLMVKLSQPQNRTMLFSLSYGLQTISGAFGALFAGQLPALFGVLLRIPEDSAMAYQAVLITSVLIGTLSLIPAYLMREPQSQSVLGRVGPTAIDSSPSSELSATAPKPAIPEKAQQATNRLSPALLSMTAKMTAPQVLIGFGAAILIPYLNVFFKDRFDISDSLLGLLFAASALLIGIGSLMAPRLSTLLGGKIRATAATQSVSLVFLLMMGFAPVLWLSALSYLARTALMNMASPLYSAFCMERTPEQHQGFVNSILSLSWSVGWAVGPYVSGVVQEQYGFTPLFAATALLYLVAIALVWNFFRHEDLVQIGAEARLHTPEFPE